MSTSLWHPGFHSSLKKETSVKGSDSVQAEVFGPDRSVKETDGGLKTTVTTGTKSPAAIYELLGVLPSVLQQAPFSLQLSCWWSGQSLEGPTFCGPSDFTVNELEWNRSWIYHLPVTWKAADLLLMSKAGEIGDEKSFTANSSQLETGYLLPTDMGG